MAYIVTSTLRKTKVHFSYDKKMFKEIFAFAAWTMNGNLAIIDLRKV